MNLKKLRNPLIIIIILGLALRIFYWVVSNGQAVWWDEAVYGNMADHWVGGSHWDFTAARPILFSVLWAGIKVVSSSEFIPRFLLLAASIAAIIGMYYIGRSMTNDKRVGWMAAFLTAIFYIHIFYTVRLLVDTLSFTFFIWGTYFFYKYFKKDTPKYFYIACAIIGAGFLFRITTALILLVIFIFILATDGLKFYKKKEYWIGALIFFAIISPYLIWGYFQFDGFVLTKAFATNAPTAFWTGGYNVLIQYVIRYFLLLPNIWAIPMVGLFILGLIMMHESLVGFDMVRKGDKKLQRDFFLLLLFIIPLVAISFLLDHFEDRYIFNVFPAIFLLSSLSFVYFYDWINQKAGKVIAGCLVIIVIMLLLISQLQAVDFTVRSKIESYRQVQEAGSWIKGNSHPDDIIIVHSYPQIQYYSERYSKHFPKTEIEFEQLDQTNFTYFVVSIFERSPEWVYQYPVRQNLSVANAWVTNKNEPILVIYNLK